MPSSRMVGPHHHDGGVPADVGPDAPLDVLVAGEPRLLVGRDGVDVRGRDRGREADLALPGPLEQLHQQEAGAGLPVGLDDGVEGVEPLGGLLRIDVGYLVRETVEDHPTVSRPRQVRPAAPSGRTGARLDRGRPCSRPRRPSPAATVVFTDGACIGNPGPGGWAWAVSESEYESGHDEPDDQSAHGGHRGAPGARRHQRSACTS